MSKEDYKWKTVDSRGESLLEAHKIINGKRQDTHGKPEDSFQTIAVYWSTYIKSMYGIDIDLSRAEVCEMMNLFKTARMAGQAYNPDNHRDAAGYLALADDFRKQAEQAEHARLDAEITEMAFPEADNFVCGRSECDGNCDRDYIASISKHHG